MKVNNTNDVKLYIETAAYVDRMLPEVKAEQYKCCMPDIIYTPQEIALMDRRPIRIRPTQEQIAIWEMVSMDWLRVLTPDERRLVWKRANHIPWKVLCWEFGFERAEMWRRYQSCLTKILFYLKGINVGNKKV